MYEYHISFSQGLFYVFAFDDFKRPVGRFKSPDFDECIYWIKKREDIPSCEENKTVFCAWGSL